MQKFNNCAQHLGTLSFHRYPTPPTTGVNNHDSLELILIRRCQAFQLLSFIHFLLFSALGQAHWQVSWRFVTEEADNLELDPQLVSVAKWASVSLNLGRLVLLLLSVMKPKVTKTYFYYEVVCFCVD